MQNVMRIVLFVFGCCMLGSLIGYFVYQYSHFDASIKPSKSSEFTQKLSPLVPESSDFSSERIPKTLDLLPEKKDKKTQNTRNMAKSLDRKSNLDTNIQKLAPNTTLLGTPKVKKPKLAIIMDDLAYPAQLKSLHELGLKITPSFFPRNLDNPKTPEMAENEEFYMVHLPLEALHFYQSSHRYLKVGESTESISEYIAEIKNDFPKLAFINNHTGSKFTASYEDMKNLIEVLQSYSIEFIDSRTTKETKAPEVYAQMNKPLLSREVFLDNTESVFDILEQIKKAIVIAKKDGFAIAIAHPHASTFEALKIAKKELLGEVELVFIKDINNIGIENDKTKD